MSKPIAVTKMTPQWVGPSKPTSPPSQTLPLSFMDRLPTMSFFLELILVFRHGRKSNPNHVHMHPGNLIKESISKALVPYYPVAGRVVNNGDSNEIEVACTDDGVLFVEAYVDCSLQDVDFLDSQPLAVDKEQLLPSFDPRGVDDTNRVVFMMQVTQFKCGGFTAGIKFNHAVFDGKGAAHFINAASEIARGHTNPTPSPIWCRDMIPSPPKQSRELQTFSTFKFERYKIDLYLDNINQLKEKFVVDTGLKCTVFEVVSAKIWQCRTRAIYPLCQNFKVTLRFPVDVRQEFKHLICPDQCYYGNCIYHIVIQASSQYVSNSPLTAIVNLIRGAKEGLSIKFARWMRGDPRENPPELEEAYSLLDLSDWRRLGLFEVDYGWGVPKHVLPTNEGVRVASCIFLNSPKLEKGIRVMTNCVVKEHLEAFCAEMEKVEY